MVKSHPSGMEAEMTLLTQGKGPSVDKISKRFTPVLEKRWKQR